MTQPAICEINNCRVLAVGRCATCGNSYCESHQAHDSFSHALYVNQCASCFAKSPSERAHTKKIADAKKYFESGTARDELLKSEVQQVSLYLSEIKTVMVNMYESEIKED